ncbi:MAG: AtpZ/AtpI family protein [Acidobacteria bacterium]|nr:AtpZ/AtpI family protein [Acidobacteriota bacterium]
MVRKGRKGSIFEDYAFLISAGFTFPVYAYIGYLIGNHLDKRFGTHPILTFFSILGLSALGFYSFLKAFSQLERRRKK